MEALIGKDRPDKDAEAVILTKYIVSPDKGLEFIEAFKSVSVCALKTPWLLQVSIEDPESVAVKVYNRL